MQIKLLKNYKPHTRVLIKGTELGVTNEEGAKLIAKGIAENITVEHNVNVIKNREELVVEKKQVKQKK